MLLTMAEKAFCIVIAVTFTLNFNWQTRVHGNTDTRECLNYTFLNESNRARTFYSSSFYEMCDSSLDGWYRFGGSAGDHMADSCIPRSHCGTDMPGWLNGSHPTVADGAVNRSVCFSAACPLPDRCCYNSANITVRNCGGFFVYKLKRPPSCKNKARYCGNGLPSVTPVSTSKPATPHGKIRECFTYTFLNESDRARTFRNTSWAWSSLYDLKLDGWYRFGGGAGDQMADSCVPYRHCRAQRPGWLNGSHPTVADGAVNRFVCFSSLSDCCQFSTSITVRNCGGFFVYKLKRAPVCVPMSIARYCGNGLPSATPVSTSKPATPQFTGKIRVPTSKPAKPRFTGEIRDALECPPQSRNGVSWSATRGGQTDIKPCPEGATGSSSRKCSKAGNWRKPNFTDCTSSEFLKLANMMHTIMDGLHPDLNVGQVLLKLFNFTQPRNNSSSRPAHIYGGDLIIAMDILYQTAEYNARFGNVSSKEDFQNYVQVASNLMEPVNRGTWVDLDRAGQNKSLMMVYTMDAYGLGVAATLNASTKMDFQSKNLMMRIDHVDQDSPTSLPNKKALEIISIIGCSISLFAVLITMAVTLVFWRQLKSPRVKVLLNLCAAIACSCILVILEGSARNKEPECTVVAALLHYCLLALFSWMLCEGILHYIVIVRVVHGDHEDKVKFFYLFGWGFPATMVIISLSVTQLKGYGHKEACWLNADKGLIWAFIVPALGVILVNIVVFILVMRQMMGTKYMQNKTQVEKVRTGVKASGVILPLLGITWLFGLLSFNSDTIIFKYIFTIFNSLQGLMIFIFHCLLNKQIKDAFGKRRKRWVSTRHDKRTSLNLRNKCEAAVIPGQAAKNLSNPIQDGVDQLPETRGIHSDTMKISTFISQDDVGSGVVEDLPLEGSINLTLSADD